MRLLMRSAALDNTEHEFQVFCPRCSFALPDVLDYSRATQRGPISAYPMGDGLPFLRSGSGTSGLKHCWLARIAHQIRV